MTILAALFQHTGPTFTVPWKAWQTATGFNVSVDCRQPCTSGPAEICIVTSSNEKVAVVKKFIHYVLVWLSVLKQIYI